MATLQNLTCLIGSSPSSSHSDRCLGCCLSADAVSSHPTDLLKDQGPVFLMPWTSHFTILSLSMVDLLVFFAAVRSQGLIRPTLYFFQTLFSRYSITHSKAYGGFYDPELTRRCCSQNNLTVDTMPHS